MQMPCDYNKNNLNKNQNDLEWWEKLKEYNCYQKEEFV